MSKILLLTGFSTDMRYGGGAIVRSLLEQFEPDDVAWFSMAPPTANLEPHFRKLLVGHCSYRAFGNRRLRLAKFWAWFHCTVWPKLAARRIMSALSQTGAGTLWIVLDYQLVPIAAELIRRRPKQHLHFSIHDHPNEMARHHFVSSASVDAVDQGFEVVKDTNASFDAVSEELLAATGLAGRPSAIVSMGGDKSRQSHGFIPKKDGALRIGHAGSYFSPERAHELVEGLKLWSARTGRPWEVHAFGAEMSLQMPPDIRWRGFYPPDTLFNELGGMDILLLALDGYGTPNAPSLTCLPTKLVSYIEVGRPVLAMVPAGSATARIVRESSLGSVVSTSDTQAVVRAISDAVSWDIELAARGRAVLLNDRFDPDSIASRLRRLLELGDAECSAAMSLPERRVKNE